MEVRYVWIAMAAAKYSENINTGDVTRRFILIYIIFFPLPLVTDAIITQIFPITILSGYVEGGGAIVLSVNIT